MAKSKGAPRAPKLTPEQVQSASKTEAARKTASKASLQIAALRKLAQDEYSKDHGVAVETFDDSDYANLIAEHGTAKKAWAFHLRVVAAQREAQHADEADAEIASERKAMEHDAYLAALRVDALATIGEAATEEQIAAYIAEQTAPTEATSKAKYAGPMIALRAAAKHYVTNKHGNPNCGDQLATVLADLTRAQVVDVLIKAMKLESNPYAYLNPGQQSMNLRNKARGMLVKGTLKVEEIVAAIERAARHPE